MRIRLDRTICDGFGVCAARAPGYFSLDDWGYASLTGDGQVAPEDEAAVNRAILDCPVHAVTVLREPPWSEESRLRRAVRVVHRRPGRDERVDLRAEISQDHDAERTGSAALQFHDSKPGEWSCH